MSFLSLAEFMRTAHPCHMDPFVAKQLANERWQELINQPAPMTRNPIRRAVRLWLRQADAWLALGHAPDHVEPFDFIDGDCSQQPA